MIRTIIYLVCLFICLGYTFADIKSKGFKALKNEVHNRNFWLDIAFILVIPQLGVLALLLDKFWVSKVK